MPYGLTLTASHVYWTDWKRPGVHGAWRASGERLASLPYVLEDMGRPFDVMVVSSECPASTSVCQRSDCGPGKLCLPDGRGQARCHWNTQLCLSHQNLFISCLDFSVDTWVKNSLLQLLLGSDVGRVATLLLAAIGGSLVEPGVTLAANHLVAVVFLGQQPQRRLDDTAAKTQHQMESRLCEI